MAWARPRTTASVCLRPAFDAARTVAARETIPMKSNSHGSNFNLHVNAEIDARPTYATRRQRDTRIGVELRAHFERCKQPVPRNPAPTFPIGDPEWWEVRCSGGPNDPTDD